MFKLFVCRTYSFENRQWRGVSQAIEYSIDHFISVYYLSHRFWHPNYAIHKRRPGSIAANFWFAFYFCFQLQHLPWDVLCAVFALPAPSCFSHVTNFHIWRPSCVAANIWFDYFCFCCRLWHLQWNVPRAVFALLAHCSFSHIINTWPDKWLISHCR